MNELAMADDLFLTTLDRYNASRDFQDKRFYSACYAPFTSLYLDQLGNVRVCCQNTEHVVGNIVTESLEAIWNGEKIRQLRQALRQSDLRVGCQFCEWGFLDGNAAGGFMKRFDELPVDDESPSFPKRMEFSISNTCNLECVMCNGEWSSSIRTRREKLPPLPKVYPDRFFDELRRFLPALERADFFGGEPFLERETFRIWDMMIELGLGTLCHVTTNGTQFNSRVERVLDALPFSFQISIDGATAATVESIRRNARFDEVLANARRFLEYAKERGTVFGFSYCLMVPNWHEFGDFLLLADDWDVDVCVNTVTWPVDLSLFQLPINELAVVARELEQRDAGYRTRLGRNRQVWIDEFERIQRAVTHSDEERFYRPFGDDPFLRDAIRLKEVLVDVFVPEGDSFKKTQVPMMRVPPAWGDFAREVSLADSMTVDQARGLLEAWSPGEPIARLDCDSTLTVISSDVEQYPTFRLGERTLVGRPLIDVRHVLSEGLGLATPVSSDQRPTHGDDVVRFRNDSGEETDLRAISIPKFDDVGSLAGYTLVVVLRPSV
jgi:radical SAM protein with 4Fe4S-binding SPASM domain